MRPDVRAQAVVDMAAFARARGETVQLAALDRGRVVYLDAIDPRGHRQTGITAPLLSAAGIALMADQPEAERRSLVSGVDGAELAASGFPTREALAAHLDLVQARGYALAQTTGIAAIAAPILDGTCAVAAIAIEGRSDRLSRATLHALAPGLIEATRAATRGAGGTLRPNSATPRPGPASAAVKPLVETGNLIGEAPIHDADNDRLYWVDMYEPAIFCLDLQSGALSAFAPGEMVAALALAPDGLVFAGQSGLWLADATTGEPRRRLGHPENHFPGNRFNESKRDRHGRLWVNTVSWRFAPNAGSLYRMEAEGRFQRMDTGLHVPNGMAWSPDGRTMYLADSGPRVIYAYDVADERGEISGRRTLVQLAADASGAPDGLAVDDRGNLWVAMFDGWRISQFSPSGALLREIVLPVPRPTSCCFGGDGRTLFVTSARIRVSEATLREAPLSGAIFSVAV
jgi:sugar lactone lactonase YvrE